MSTIDASELLRPGLLEGVSILLVGAALPAGTEDTPSLCDRVGRVCAGLGARVCELGIDVRGELGQDAIEQAAREAVERALTGGGTIELLAVDCASVFAGASVTVGDDSGAGAAGAREALRACLDAAWNVTRVVVEQAFLPDAHGGRIVYVAPAADGGEYVDAARAGLENLARTLSIEWAQHRITPVTIAPAVGTSGEVAALTAYLASPAGDYFSGCLLDLRGARS